MNRLPAELTFDLVAAEEIPAAHALEASEFPPDEAATLATFKMRQAVAPSLFLGAFLPSLSVDEGRTIVGYVCATRSVFPTLTHASMERHDPEGRSVCIHAVVVAKPQQKHGIASALLRQFIARVRDEGIYKRILLICHSDIRFLYENVGFEHVGPSAVVHGALPWSEMRIMLSEPSDDERDVSPNNSSTTPMSPVVEARSPPASGSGSIPTGLFEALRLSSASRKRPPTRSFNSFNGLDNLSSASADSFDLKRNKFDILCPRSGCGSVILKDNVGKLVDKELAELEITGSAPESLLAPLPPSGTSVPCWLVQPSPMAFENIGFSRVVERSSDAEGTRPTLKLLSCADCDLGPLGWCVSGGREFWLVCARVGYRA